MKRLSYHEEKEMREERKAQKRARQQRNAKRRGKNWFNVAKDIAEEAA